MDTKNRITNNLLKAAKKHRILTYPVLALVALIGVISYFFDWSKGAGKRVVAIVMVLVMLVSQSYFLTSSATEVSDDVTQQTLANEASESEEVVVDDTIDTTIDGNPVYDETEPAEYTDVTEDSSDMNTSEDEVPGEEETGDDASTEEDSVEDGTIEDSTDLSDQDGDVEEATTEVDFNDTPLETGENPGSSEGEQEKVSVVLDYVNYDHTGATVINSENEVTSSDGGNNYDFSSVMTNLTTAITNADEADECYKYSTTLYLDINCSEQLTNSVSSSYVQTIDGNKSIVVYCLRELENYKVTIVSGGTGQADDTVKYKVGDKNEPSTVLVKADGLANNKTGTFTITEAQRFGYDATRPTVSGNGTGSVGEDGKTITVNLVGQDTCERTVTLGWQGKSYTVLYSQEKYSGGAAEVSKCTPQDLVYGGNYYFLTQEDARAVDYPGYDFKQWNIGEATVNASSPITMAYHKKLYNPNGTTIIYPEYEDVSIKIDKESVEAQYLIPIKNNDIVIKPYYDYKVGNKDTSGNFTYSFNSGKDTLEGIGINVTTDDKGIHLKSTDGPDTTGTYSLKFTVSDETRTSDEFTVTVKVNPQTVDVDIPESWKLKEYDGNDNVNTDFGAKLPTKSVDPNGNPITVSYSSAKYDSANAGNNKTITISGCTMDDFTGKENYLLNANGQVVTIDNCEITKKEILVKTTSSVSKIRTGESNPEDSSFGIYPYGNNKFVGSDDIAALGKITYYTDPSRENDLETPYDKVYVKAEAEETSNYTVLCYQENCASFAVVQEAPVLGTNYTIDGKMSEDGSWYVGLGDDAPKLKPINNTALLGGGYDQICISYDGGTTFSEPADFVTLEKTNPNHNIKIQLKSGTGAITSMGSLDSNYDPDGPDYLGYSFTSENDISYNWDDALNNGGLYFPSHGGVLSFGTYVKSVLHIKVRFEDNISGLDKLNYGIFTSDVSGNTALFDDEGIATIEVLRDAVQDRKGVITCQAVDKAGNESKLIILRPSGNTNDTYEWSVEAKEPDQCELTVTYGDDDSLPNGMRGTVTSYQEGAKKVYYRNCKASLHVVDNESGIKNVKWYINENETDVQAPDNSMEQKVTSYDFSYGDNTLFSSSTSLYTVYAVVEDNAGNTKQSTPISFFVDNDVPELHVNYDEDVNKWTSNEEITFTTSDAISDVAYAQVLKSDGSVTNINLSNPVNGEYTGSFTITGKGSYTVRVGDNAGNVHEETFNVQNISKEIPDCPEISVLPEAGTDEEGNPIEEYWYNSETGAPVVTISNVVLTSDMTPVNTYYRHYKNDETAYDDVLIDKDLDSKEIPISETDEAIHYFEYWSESYSGVECDNKESHIAVVRYDKSAPEVEVKNVPEESSGSTVKIQFTIKDNLSGIDKDSIAVLRNGKKFESTLEETEDGYIGSFVVKETGNYVVTATDIAGNVAEVPGFTPMSMVVDPISNISTAKATISAKVYKGTADISTAPTVSIKKETDSKFVESANTIANQDEKGNWDVSAVFDNLDENTVYVYKVFAVSDIDEVLEYQGYLRTSAFDQEGCTIRGTVGYPSGALLPSWNESGIITVGLYDGNVCIAATTAQAGDTFTFNNVPDGTYTIVATDGVYKKSQAVTVDNQIVVKPGSAISLVLSGQNTSVVISSPDTPKIIADNMDSIFLYDTEVNFNDEDRALIMANGTVEFRLYATLTNVVDVSKDELAIIQRVGSDGKIVAKYLDLSLEKISTDAEGNVERSWVSELANGANITITIPLQDLAGKKGIEVVRVHNGSNGLEGYRYETDMDSNPYTFTISSNKFSTYAILYSPDSDSTTEQDSSDSKTTENKTDGSISSEDKTTASTTTDDRTSQRRTTQDRTTQDRTSEENPITPPDNTAQSGSSSNSFSSVSSGSGSAKTGDATPLAAVGLLMMVSLGGVFTLRRKLK